MSSDAIEGEQSYSENTPIFSPSMSSLNASSEPTFKTILDPDNPSYAKSHNNLINMLRHLKHKKYDYENDQEWLQHMKNACTIIEE